MSAPAQQPPVWLRPPVIVAVVLALFLARSFAAFDTDLVADEGYYTLWSLHLQPGYLDHPPAVAWAIAAGRALLGEHSLGVRAAALISPLLISAALYRSGTILLGPAVAALAVLWYNLSLGISLSLLATPDVPSTLFWMLALWAVTEFIRSRNPNWWLLVGLFGGLGVLGKYTNLFLAPGLLLFLVSSRERWLWLRLWQLWAGGVVALLVVAPNLWWNLGQDWAGLLFQGRRVFTSILPDLQRNYFDLIAGQALFLGPVTLLFALISMLLWAMRPTHADRAPLALPVLSGLPALAYFVFHASHSHVEANWLLPLWPMLALLAAWLPLRGVPRIRGLWHAARAGLYLQTLFGLVVVGLLQWIVLAHPSRLGPYDITHLDRTRDTRGWHELRVAIEGMAEQSGAEWIGVIDNYGIVGLLSTYGHFLGSERPVLGIGDAYRYGFRPPPSPELLRSRGLLVLWQGSEGYRLQPESLFGDVTELGTIERRFGAETFAEYRIVVVAEPQEEFLSGIVR